MEILVKETHYLLPRILLGSAFVSVLLVIMNFVIAPPEVWVTVSVITIIANIFGIFFARELDEKYIHRRTVLILLSGILSWSIGCLLGSAEYLNASYILTRIPALIVCDFILIFFPEYYASYSVYGNFVFHHILSFLRLDLTHS